MKALRCMQMLSIGLFIGLFIGSALLQGCGKSNDEAQDQQNANEEKTVSASELFCTIKGSEDLVQNCASEKPADIQKKLRARLGAYAKKESFPAFLMHTRAFQKEFALTPAQQSCIENKICSEL